MVFKVSKFSGVFSGREKPCDEAWSDGKKGHWKVDINTIEELSNVVRKSNYVVLYEDKGQLSLDIYGKYLGL